MMPGGAGHALAGFVAPMTALDDEDDAALVSRCLRGEGGAWTALVRRYQRLVYAIALRMGFDDHAAADVFQTVFARLVKHMPSIENPHLLQAWIVTTAKREALLQRERAARTVSMTRPDEADADASADWDVPDEALLPEEALAELQQQNQVRNALERLDERCRSLLSMLFSDDDNVPYADIARRLGVSVGSIGPTRARCLEKLRRLVS